MIRISFLILMLISKIFGQDELLDLIGDNNLDTMPIQATFKATRIVNAQSIKIPRQKTLEFMILHRFGSMSNGFYDLFGMDEAVIRFDLKYGLRENFSMGIGRSSLKKTYDIFSKIRFLRQKYGQRPIPISLVLFTKIEIETAIKDMDTFDRFTFDIQALFARKFNQNLSLQIMPTYIHKNLVYSKNEANTLLSIGFGGRLKISKRTSINFDTFLPIDSRPKTYIRGWGLGYDIDTGGHIFQLMITNAQGSYESQYIENATGDIENFNLYIGFNITRVFTL